LASPVLWGGRRRRRLLLLLLLPTPRTTTTTTRRTTPTTPSTVSCCTRRAPGERPLRSRDSPRCHTLRYNHPLEAEGNKTGVDDSVLAALSVYTRGLAFEVC